jgi:hypothetical protein
MSEPLKIVVIGLGYVGLPLAVALSRKFDVIGFDIDPERIGELRDGHDRTREIDPEALAASGLSLSSGSADIAGADVYIVTVPTPVDDAKRPDLGAVMEATRTVAEAIQAERRPTIVYESTVYPGVTEGICGPEIERISGLERGRDFRLGYSPERINPGDRQHTIDRITKVIAGEDSEVLEQLAGIYGAITEGGVFRAASIKAAEGAKAIENAQRDINIAFMNEVAQMLPDRRVRLGRARRRADEVELSALRARACRRPLHRRRSILSKPPRAATRPPPRGNPRWPRDQRRHGRVDCRYVARAARQGRVRARAWPHVQGECAGPAQQPQLRPDPPPAGARPFGRGGRPAC